MQMNQPSRICAALAFWHRTATSPTDRNTGSLHAGHLSGMLNSVSVPSRFDYRAHNLRNHVSSLSDHDYVSNTDVFLPDDVLIVQQALLTTDPANLTGSRIARGVGLRSVRLHIYSLEPSLHLFRCKLERNCPTRLWQCRELTLRGQGVDLMTAPSMSAATRCEWTVDGTFLQPRQYPDSYVCWLTGNPASFKNSRASRSSIQGFRHPPVCMQKS